jgi:hypothetical protein
MATIKEKHRNITANNSPDPPSQLQDEELNYQVQDSCKENGSIPRNFSCLQNSKSTCKKSNTER